MTKWRMLWQIIRNVASQIGHILFAQPMRDIEDFVCLDPEMRAEMAGWDEASAEALSAFPYVLDDNSIDTPSAGYAEDRCD